MNAGAHTVDCTLKREGAERAIAKASILTLLIALVGLSILAKQAQYYPRTNPVRHISTSTKMNVPQTATVIAREPQQPVAKVIPPQLQPRAAKIAAPELTCVPWIHLTLSLQHRSPPSRA
jgi:hypothetical protein